MPTTTGMPEQSSRYGEDWRHATNNPWAQEAIAARGYSDFDAVAVTDDEGEPAEPSPRAGSNRSKRTVAAVRAAIADAMGIGVADLDDEGISLDGLTDIIHNDLTDPQAALDALDDALAYPTAPDAPQAAKGESEGGYVVREGNWRERHNMPRHRKTTPPSRTTVGRRASHIAAKAERLGISIAEAEAMTPRRKSAGKKRPFKPRKPDHAE